MPELGQRFDAFHLPVSVGRPLEEVEVPGSIHPFLAQSYECQGRVPLPNGCSTSSPDTLAAEAVSVVPDWWSFLQKQCSKSPGCP